ncbi:MAG: hypothetical protein ABSC25_24345 [Roseiarcus sp.]|jgi:hypothetical protein
MNTLGNANAADLRKRLDGLSKAVNKLASYLPRIEKLESLLLPTNGRLHKMKGIQL